MTTKNDIQPETISCDVCLNEIPNTVNQNAEADEYVSNYCGLECYQQWKETDVTNEKQTGEKTTP